MHCLQYVTAFFNDTIKAGQNGQQKNKIKNLVKMVNRKRKHKETDQNGQQKEKR